MSQLTDTLTAARNAKNNFEGQLRGLALKNGGTAQLHTTTKYTLPVTLVALPFLAQLTTLVGPEFSVCEETRAPQQRIYTYKVKNLCSLVVNFVYATPTAPAKLSWHHTFQA